MAVVSWGAACSGEQASSSAGYGILVDGYTGPNGGSGFCRQDGQAWVMLDLGTVYDLWRIAVWHYWDDGRTYYNTKTEISEDGVNWTAVFDSSVSGVYQENSGGHWLQFPLTKARYIRDWCGPSTTNNYAAWYEIRAWDGVAVIDQAIIPYVAAVMKNEPWSYWRLDESSGLVFRDVSGNYNDGIVEGGITLGQPGATADGNAAASFNGSSGYMATTLSQNNPVVFSLEAWFKTTGTGGIITFGSAQTGSDGSHDRKIYIDAGGVLKFGIYPGSVVIVQTPSPVNEGAWHHVVGTLDGSGMKLYLDGKQVGANGSNNPQTYGGFWRAGFYDTGGWGSGSAFFQGELDEVAVYNSALSPADIAAHYQAALETGGKRSPVVSFF